MNKRIKSKKEAEALRRQRLELAFETEMLINQIEETIGALKSADSAAKELDKAKAELYQAKEVRREAEKRLQRQLVMGGALERIAVDILTKAKEIKDEEQELKVLAFIIAAFTVLKFIFDIFL